MKKLLLILMSVAMLTIGCTACKDDAEPKESPKATQTAEAVKTDAPKKEVADVYARKIMFTIEMNDGGVMKGELYPDLAPITVDNFVKLVNEKFYDGLIFHRVIPGFMIQGGGFDKDFVPKETASIKGEFESNGVKNDLKHERGVLSMARTMVPDSASSQFFIMHETSPHLDGEYAAFGRITEGLEIVDKIAGVETTVVAETGMSDVPTEPQIIKTITITEGEQAE